MSFAHRFRLLALVRWVFPLVSLATTLASQILLPRILQYRLSTGEYVSYVAVTSLAAYLGLADGGMLLTIVREMSVLHGANDRARFAGEARRARRVFAAIAVVGCGIAALGLSSVLAASESAWSGASHPAFHVSVAAVLLSTGLLMGVGSYHTVVLFSTDRMLAGQAMSVIGVIVPLVALVATLVVERNLTLGLFAFAGATAVVALGRAWHVRGCMRCETGSVAPSAPPTPLLRLIMAGVALKAADVLPGSAYPHLLSVQAPELVPTGVPTRTYANACRVLPQQFLNLLQVHVTRRLAGGPAERLRGEREYVTAASSLCALQLLALGAAALLAVPVFRLWLPLSADHVLKYLPGLLAEQALLSASLPSSILFTAGGRLRLLGAVRLAGVFLGLIVFLVALPCAREAAYGMGFAAGAVPLFVLASWAELRPALAFPRPRAHTIARYAGSLCAAACCAFYASRPLLAGCFIALCGMALLPASLPALWRMVSVSEPVPPEGA